MKKIISILLVLLLALGLVACGNKEVKVEGTLEEIMTKLYADIPQDKRPNALQNTEVNSENIEWFLGTSDIDYKEALASESMIGSIPHSVVLIRANEGADVEAIKTAIKENLNTRKWVCVGIEPDELIVENIGDLIVVILDGIENADTIKASFDNLIK